MQVFNLRKIEVSKRSDGLKRLKKFMVIVINYLATFYQSACAKLGNDW
jgi:hypothetical protein